MCMLKKFRLYIRTHLLPGLFVDSELYFAISALAQFADDVKPASNRSFLNLQIAGLFRIDE
jgi:hypothetical protein